MNKYYLNFIPRANVNYLYLFRLAGIAEYDEENTTSFFIKFRSVKDLSDKSGIKQSTLRRILTNSQYNSFFIYDKNNNWIDLITDTNEMQRFVVLDNNERYILLDINDNLLCKYYIYLKYYCSYSLFNNAQQDFTYNQFFTECNYSVKSVSYKTKLSRYNDILQSIGLLNVRKYKDELGHNRNIYTLNTDTTRSLHLYTNTLDKSFNTYLKM